ncbi:MAG: epoxyqueuosine reductase QueH [Treponema sp.]|jgi:tRNA A37 threonylcarbamoyladenosine dehydratase/predicted adenine nucleotide alpha hydrolase (AANH) superfamily ATPase|nr:epoxyqueuosine reductase QueH [Treponema sp.]
MKLLFHCCCGPCATGCIESLVAEGITPILFWYNPNIHPTTEYRNRRDALSALAAAKNLELEMADAYGLRSFLKETGTRTEAPERCEVCYRMRLTKTAEYAAEKGFDAFSTSLLISPYQQHDVIRRIGEELATHYGLEFLYRDFRPLFREGQAQARALGLYMQKYCGCIYGEEERNVKNNTPQIARHQAVSIDKKPYDENSDNDCNNHDEQKDKIALVSLADMGMINPLFQRLALLTGAEVLEKLARTSVLLVGVGGVGSWCTEALVRSGVGKISIVDFDTVCVSNVNRQLEATSQTLGRVKVEVLKQRLLEINPRCEVSAWEKVFSRENAEEFGIEKMNYVVDAIDSLNNKLDLIEASCASGAKLFSSMGMARKMDPMRIKTASIWKTQGCPLARLVREGLRKRGFSGDFTAVYSDERLEQHDETAFDISTNESTNGKKVNGSVVTVTATAGMVLASLVLQDITGINRVTNG